MKERNTEEIKWSVISSSMPPIVILRLIARCLKCFWGDFLWCVMFLSVWTYSLPPKAAPLCPCSKACILSISLTRQEHSETLMLRKKAKDLETEYKQLQLEYQGKEGRVIALENEVEVNYPFASVDSLRCTCHVCEFNVCTHVQSLLKWYSIVCSFGWSGCVDVWFVVCDLCVYSLCTVCCLWIWVGLTVLVAVILCLFWSAFVLAWIQRYNVALRIGIH